MHKSLKIDALKYETLNLSDSIAEVLVLEVSQKLAKPFVLITCYRPLQGNQAEFKAKVKGVLHELGADVNIMLVGDFNIDLSTHTRSSKELKAMSDELNLKQLVNQPTRITRSSSTIIDHIYTNIACVTKVGVIPINSSDHYPTYSIIKKQKN